MVPGSDLRHARPSPPRDGQGTCGEAFRR
jgi:hypothetical protein